MLTDGGLYTSTIVLKRRSGGGTGKIVLRSQTLPCIEGIQVHPSMWTTQAELRQTAGGFGPIIMTEQGGIALCDNYMLVGLNITSTSSDTNSLVQFGDGGGNQNTFAKVPQNLWMDRCQAIGLNARRAVGLHSG